MHPLPSRVGGELDQAAAADGWNAHVDDAEEIVWRESDNTALRIYTTTDVTKRRIYTLMHDPQYRVAISWQNTAYNQPPHPSFQIGSGMADPPKPTTWSLVE